MTVPVSYVELNSPDLDASVRFFEDVTARDEDLPGLVFCTPLKAASHDPMA